MQVDLGKLTAPITSHNIGDVRSYYDIRWSPDGERLVLEMVGWEWVSHAIYTLSTARLQEMELQTVGVGLADSVWSQDGQMLTMSGWGAGPTARLINLHLPTGEVQRLDQTFTESTPPVGVIKAAFPLPSGKLLAFLIPELQPTHYNLFRLFWLSLDGAIDKPASDQTFIIQGEVLWAPDGSGALLMTSDISLPGEAAKGKYEWFSHETDRLTAPYIRGSHVRWGLPTKP